MQGIGKGIEQGETRGIEKTATLMLKENADIGFISRVTGLSKNTILKIKNRL